jgi:hypothetical protein
MKLLPIALSCLYLGFAADQNAPVRSSSTAFDAIRKSRPAPAQRSFRLKITGPNEALLLLG